MSEAFNDLLSAIDHDSFGYDPREDGADIDICRECEQNIIWFPRDGKEVMFDLIGSIHKCHNQPTTNYIL